MKLFSDKNCEGTHNTRFMCNSFFPKITLDSQGCERAQNK